MRLLGNQGNQGIVRKIENDQREILKFFKEVKICISYTYIVFKMRSKVHFLIIPFMKVPMLRLIYFLTRIFRRRISRVGNICRKSTNILPT